MPSESELGDEGVGDAEGGEQSELGQPRKTRCVDLNIKCWPRLPTRA